MQQKFGPRFNSQRMRTGIPLALARPGPARAAGRILRLPSMPSTRPPASKRAYRCEHKTTLLHCVLVILQILQNSCLYCFDLTIKLLDFRVIYIMHSPYHCLTLQEEKGSDYEEEDEKSATNTENMTSNSSVPGSR